MPSDIKKVTVKSETAKGLEMSLLEHTFGKKGLLEGILTENTPNPLEDIDLEELEEQLPEIEDLIDDLPMLTICMQNCMMQAAYMRYLTLESTKKK